MEGRWGGGEVEGVGRGGGVGWGGRGGEGHDREHCILCQ